MQSNLKNFAYTTIKEKILRCEYEPGSVMNENILCDELGVSRTPVREALNRLSQEDLVQVWPKKGILISNIGLGDIRELYQARKLLEPHVVREAAARLGADALQKLRARCEEAIQSGGDFSGHDTELHMCFADNCGNKFICDVMHKLWDRNTRIRFFSGYTSSNESSLAEHLALIDALLAGDLDGASALMLSHVENCAARTFGALSV